MPKNIAVFCDGTWNSPWAPNSTHVQKLYEAAHEVEQVNSSLVCWYFPGVGAGAHFTSHLGKAFDKVGGGAFGMGLTKNILKAYEFLARTYESGDQIFLFGFSRGAFTVRSLAGMIRKSGLPAEVTKSSVKQALELYRMRGEENHPDAPHTQNARKAMSPKFATSQEDLAFRDGQGDIIQIAYLGVWDTVGAMGVPNLLGKVSEFLNRRHAFHDMVLSSSVQSARHAMALDERRYFFQPALWNNLARLNSGFSEEDPKRPYQQVWFAGDHGMVGGSGANEALASHTLDWVVEGAVEKGLQVDPSLLMQGVVRDPLNRKPLKIKTKAIYKLNRRKLYAWRKGPEAKAVHTLSASADTLFGRDSGYRPKSLSRLYPNEFFT